MNPKTRDMALFLTLHAVLAVSGCGTDTWERRLEDAVTSPVVLSDGLAFHASTFFGVTHYLSASDPERKMVAWQTRLPGWDAYQRVAAADGVVVAASREYLRAFAAPSGRGLWRKDIACQDVEALDLGGGVAVVQLLAEGGARELLMVRATDGNTIERIPIEPDMPAWQAGEGVYLGDADGLRAFDRQTGRLLWRSILAAPPLSLVRGDGTLIVACHDRLIGVALHDGRVRWERPTDGQVTFRAQGSLGCYAQGAELRAIDTRTGTTLWLRRVGGVVRPPIVSERGVLLHTAGGMLLALDRTDGGVLWMMNAGAPGLLEAASEGFYAWLTPDAVRVVDLARREELDAIPAGSGPEEGGSGAGIVSGPWLDISGGWLWFVDRFGSRIVLRDLGGRPSPASTVPGTPVAPAVRQEVGTTNSTGEDAR